MIFRNVDAENDWQFGKGLASYATGELAIEVNIKTRILSWVGNCFFATQEGVDWTNRLEKGQIKNLEYEIQSIIMQSYGVIGINSFSTEFDITTRTLRIVYDIQTIYSPSFLRTVEQASGSGGIYA